jgi:succinate dehydrogenase/fumarate reductase flavoprotein subunit
MRPKSAEGDSMSEVPEPAERPAARSLVDRIGRERAAELMAEAVRDAIAELHAAGLPAVGGENGRVYKDYADGTRIYLDEEEPNAREFRLYADGTKVYLDEAEHD